MFIVFSLFFIIVGRETSCTVKLFAEQVVQCTAALCCDCRLLLLAKLLKFYHRSSLILIYVSYLLRLYTYYCICTQCRRQRRVVCQWWYLHTCCVNQCCVIDYVYLFIEPFLCRPESSTSCRPIVQMMIVMSCLHDWPHGRRLVS